MLCFMKLPYMQVKRLLVFRFKPDFLKTAPKRNYQYCDGE